MQEVYIVADASRCDNLKVGAIAWAIICNDQVIYNARPVFDDIDIGKLELMAIREALTDSRRIRRKFHRVRLIAVTDNVHALISLKIARMSKNEYPCKYLLKALPHRYRFIKEYHSHCDNLCSETLTTARNEVR